MNRKQENQDNLIRVAAFVIGVLAAVVFFDSSPTQPTGKTLMAGFFMLGGIGTALGPFFFKNRGF